MYKDLGTISTRDPVDNIASLLMWSGVFHFHQSGLSVVWGRKSILTLTVDNDGRTASESPWLYGITIEVCFSSSVLRNLDDALWLAFRRKDLGLFLDSSAAKILEHLYAEEEERTSARLLTTADL